MDESVHTQITQDVPHGPITFVSTLAVTSPPPPTLPLPHIPGYEMLRTLKHGGMGVVYEARQLAADRIVALKMILVSNALPEQLERFRAEARAVAQLSHPGIVQIHEVGEYQGQPYFSLEFCPGGSLKDRLRQTPLSPREAAALIAVVARATQAAHDAGIVHRDLTPGNILFQRVEGGGGRVEGESPASSVHSPLATLQPKIADFGLAKKLDDTCRTQSGAIMGTPCYMAPEQAVGQSKQVGPAADVWALGAILYECLTGIPPFKGDTALETVLLVVTQDPIPPRRVKPDVPRDLEIICLKCLHKEPERRYRSATALSHDVERWLRGEPIQARQVALLERLGLWTRRRPAQAAALVLSLLAGLFAAFAVSSSWLWWNAATARDEAEKAQRASEEAGQREREAQERLRSVSSLHQVELAYRDWQGNAVARARLLLQNCPEIYRDWEWFHIHHLCHQHHMSIGDHPGTVRAVGFRPDGKQLATASDDRVVRLWHTETGALQYTLKEPAQPITCLTYSRNGKRLVAGCADGTLWVWDSQTNERVHRIEAHKHPITGLSLSGDSEWIASAAGGTRDEGDIKIHDLHTGRLVRSLSGFTTGLRQTHTLVFSPNGKQLAATIRDHVIKVWTLEFDRELASLTGHADTVTSLAFSPDGQFLVSGSRDRTVRCWDLQQEKETMRQRAHSGAVTCVGFSTDGRTIVSGGEDRLIQMWNFETGSLVGTIKGHDHPLTSLALHPDGKRLVSAGGANGQAGEVRLWSLDAGQTSVAFRASPSAIRCLTFTPDGEWLLTGGDDRLAAAWDTRTGQAIAIPPQHDGPITALAVSKDEQWVTTASADHTVRLWESTTGVLVATLTGHSAEVNHVAFSPDGKRLASAGQDGTVRIWDRATTKELHCLKKHQGDVRTVAFLDDTRLVSGGSDKVAIVWNAETGEKLGEARGHEGAITCVTSGPGRDQFVTGSSDTNVRVWNGTTCEEVHFLRRRDFPVRAVFCPADGSHLVAVDENNVVDVWKPDGTWVNSEEAVRLTVRPDQRTFSPLGPPGNTLTYRYENRSYPRPLLIQRGSSVSVALSNDGKTVKWGNAEGRWNQFDIATGQPLRPGLLHEAAVLRIDLDNKDRFTAVDAGGRRRTWEVSTGRLLKSGAGDVPRPGPLERNGRTLVLHSSDRSVSVRESASGHELLRLRGHLAEVTCATFSPDGKRIVTGAADGTLKVWDVASGQDSLTLTELESPIVCLVFSPDGKQLAATTASGEVRIWSAPGYTPRARLAD